MNGWILAAILWALGASSVLSSGMKILDESETDLGELEKIEQVKFAASVLFWPVLALVYLVLDTFITDNKEI